MTDGFEVLVQDVMAAMTTLPCFSESLTLCGTCSWTLGSSTPMAAGLPPSCSQRAELVAADPLVFAPVLGFISEGRAFWKESAAWERITRSCGRLGPARLGSTVARSRVSSSEYSASGVLSSWKSPCSRL